MSLIRSCNEMGLPGLRQYLVAESDDLPLGVSYLTALRHKFKKSPHLLRHEKDAGKLSFNKVLQWLWR